MGTVVGRIPTRMTYMNGTVTPFPTLRPTYKFLKLGFLKKEAKTDIGKSGPVVEDSYKSLVTDNPFITL